MVPPHKAPRDSAGGQVPAQRARTPKRVALGCAENAPRRPERTPSARSPSLGSPRRCERRPSRYSPGGVGPRTSLSQFLRQRAPLVVVTAALGASGTWGNGRVGGGDEASLREALAERIAGTVVEVAWEPAGSVLAEWVFGRGLLCTAAREGGALDVYRARVRLLPSGRPLVVGPVDNLSNSPLSKEVGLREGGGTVAFAHETETGLEALTFLRPRRALEAIRSLGVVEFGLRLWEGSEPLDLERADVLLEEAATVLELSSDEKGSRFALELALPGGGKRSLELGAEHLFGGAPAPSRDVWILRRGVSHEPITTLLANGARARLGDALFADLEEFLFRLRDRARRSVLAGTTPLADAPPVLPGVPDQGGWPPPDVPGGLAAGDGRMRPLVSRRLAETTPSPLFETTLHLDRARPYSSVRLVVLDTRRLELGLAAGYQDPVPESGPHGSGVVPAAALPQLVATMNGGFQTRHGRYGMRAEGRTFLPARAGAATIRVERSGRIGLGTDDGVPVDVEAFRQNLEPLLEDGKWNPRGRTNWGEPVVGGATITERSALGVTRSGMLVYAWSKETSAEVLAQALRLADVTYAMHLDMNPGHTHFALHDIVRETPLEATSHPLDGTMLGDPGRPLVGSAQDFFYLTLRTPLPERSTFAFRPEESAERPLFARGKRTLAHVEIEAVRFALDRYRPGFRRGERDCRIPGGRADLDGPNPAFSFALGVGHATRGSRPGLRVRETPMIPWKPGYATLVLEGGAPPRFERERASSEAATTYVQLPLLLEGGRPTDLARQVGETRTRAALAFDAHGAALWVTAKADSPIVLAQALLDEGCTTAALLDRGSHEDAEFLTSPDLLRAEPSYLTFEADPGKGRAYAWPARSGDPAASPPP